MALKPTLQIRQNQSLVLTPELKESIKFLAMTQQDISAFLEREVEANPLLEFAGEAEMEEADQRPEADPTPENTESAPMDFDKDPAPIPTSSAPTDGLDRNLENIGGAQTLRSHLEEQVSLMALDPVTKAAAVYLIDDLNDDGFLSTGLDELSMRLGVPSNALEAGLDVIQMCEPTGVGARDLAECFELQLRENGKLDDKTARVLEQFKTLATMSNDDFAVRVGITVQELSKIIGELRGLSAAPGQLFEEKEAEYVVPDVIVSWSAKTGTKIELNPAAMPNVSINTTYVLSNGKDEGKTFITKCRNRATWLLKALDQRAATILKTSAEIVRVQADFFENGPEHTKPLTQKAVAEAIGMHESTVSRVTTGKYLACDRGVIELKYFFSARFGQQEDTSAASARSIQSTIKRMVEQEKPDNILSDDKIVKALRERDIIVARRTIAKYRDAMRIPSSVERRRHKMRHAKITT